MSKDLDLEEIILYLNATEPTGKYCKNIENLQNKLSKAQEQEKVLNIIKKKRIDLFDFIRDCIEGERTDYEWYEMHYRKYSLDKLTKEEFDLLKRWVG